MEEKKKVSVLERFLHRVEVMGNKIPNPTSTYVLLLSQSPQSVPFFMSAQSTQSQVNW